MSNFVISKQTIYYIQHTKKVTSHAAACLVVSSHLLLPACRAGRQAVAACFLPVLYTCVLCTLCKGKRLPLEVYYYSTGKSINIDDLEFSD